MTKIQLAAKAAWNGFFLLFFGKTLVIFGNLSSRSVQINAHWVISFLMVCACLILSLLLLRNISLPLRIAGKTEIAKEQDWYEFFMKTNRLVCVFVGLVLLSIHFQATGSAVFLIIDFFPSVRDWFTLWVEGRISFALEKTFIAVTYIFYPFGFLLFCGYLISGADYFVRRQINLLDKYTIKEVLK